MDTIILGKEVETGNNFELKVPELMTGRTAIIAKTGYGKSWTIRRIVEQLLNMGYPVGIIDPEGEHSSLAEIFDLLIIAPDGDIDLTKASPMRLAQVAVRGVSFILDLSKYDPEISSELTASIIEALMNVKSDAGFLLVVDEAKELAPERGAGSTLGKHASLTMTWLNALATRGRKKGLGLLFSTQRPQLVSKTLLSQAENKIILRVEYSRDLSAIIEFLGLNKRVAKKITRLDKGVAYVEGPFAERSGFVRIGEVRSTHLGSTPIPKPRPPPSLKEVVDFLSISGSESLNEETIVKSEGVKEHRKEIREEENVRRSKGESSFSHRGKKISIRSSEIFLLPPQSLSSKIVKDLVKRRNEMRSLIKTLEDRKEEMRNHIYQLLLEEYEREIKQLEDSLEPYREEAREAILVLEAAIEDRKNMIIALNRNRSFLKRLHNKWKIYRIKKEIKDLERRLRKTKQILDYLR